jgi:hypothetical protein
MINSLQLTTTTKLRLALSEWTRSERECTKMHPNTPKCTQNGLFVGPVFSKNKRRRHGGKP